MPEPAARLDLLPLRVAYAEEMAVVAAPPATCTRARSGSSPHPRTPGIACAAARAVVPRGHGAGRERPVRTVVAHVHPGHPASAAVATAAGLTPTGEQQDEETRWRPALRP